MPTVDRPNKDALIKAVDIFLDSLRPLFIECLHLAPGATVQVVLQQSLKGSSADSLDRNLRRGTDLESTIEVSFFETLAEKYWEDIFSKRFGGDKRVLRKFRRISWARNKASHPPHLRDLDEELTRGSLNHIAYVLKKIRAREEHQAVVRLNETLGGSTWASAESDKEARRKAEQRAQEADAARSDAEVRARIAESAIRQAKEQAQSSEIARTEFEELAIAADAAKLEAEELAQGREHARREAEKQATRAEAAQLEAERKALTAVAELLELERRAKETQTQLRLAESRKPESAAPSPGTKDGIRKNGKSLPFARKTTQYESWLIGEIMSGNISRSMLSQYAGDTRIDGRLVHYVQAASSDMSPEAWNNYLARRHETLIRRSTVGARPRQVLRNNICQVVSH